MQKAFKPTPDELNAWLEKQILCTIATVGEGGYPNAATVAFSNTDNFQFVVITDANSRKTANIARSSKVALTITNEADKYTLQLEGNATRLAWDEFEARYSKHHYAKLPFSLPFKDIPGQTPFVITPVHMRFSDINAHPWELTEYDAPV